MMQSFRVNAIARFWTWFKTGSLRDCFFPVISLWMLAFPAAV